jgi:t-SNARE complex subunit (syntaxin)
MISIAKALDSSVSSKSMGYMENFGKDEIHIEKTFESLEEFLSDISQVNEPFKKDSGYWNTRAILIKKSKTTEETKKLIKSLNDFIMDEVNLFVVSEEINHYDRGDFMATGASGTIPSHQVS